MFGIKEYKIELKKYKFRIVDNIVIFVVSFDIEIDGIKEEDSPYYGSDELYKFETDERIYFKQPKSSNYYDVSMLDSLNSEDFYKIRFEMSTLVIEKFKELEPTIEKL